MYFEFLKSEDIDQVNNLIEKSFGFNGKLCNISDDVRFLVLKNGDKVIGNSMITKMHDPIKNIKGFYIDYVCIDSEHQHQGLGMKLMIEIEKIAKSEGVNYLKLTSSSKRCYARKLYSSFGMSIKDTNVFYKEL